MRIKMFSRGIFKCYMINAIQKKKEQKVQMKKANEKGQ